MRRRNVKWLIKAVFLTIVGITLFVAIISTISSSSATNRISQNLQETNAKLKKDIARLFPSEDIRHDVEGNEIENAQRLRMADLIVENDGEKIDWHDYEAMEKDSKRVGIGEGGKRATLDAEYRTLETKMFRQNGFNALLSDSISVNRSIPDIRNPGCKTKKYLKNLPTVSVVIPFYNEHFSVLMRSVHSIVNRSPKKLLKEVILVDDFSDREYLKKELDQYLAENFNNAQVIRLPERTGLIGARLAGAKKATGQVLIFLDSHIEANYNWLPPLLEPIAENPRISVCPFIDVLDYNNFEYRAQDEGARGAFDWEFYYKRLNLLPEDLIDKTKPFRSPIMAGGLFAISTDFFWELGGYDEGLDIWGGEQYELSFKIWMCGGQLLDAPCSRVAHIYRGPMDSKNPRKTDYVHKNYKRVAEVWMDEYKEYIYEHSPGVYDNIDPGDLSKQKAIRKKLKCKSFKWFMTEIAFDLPKVYPPVEPPDYASGVIQSVASPKLCVDTLNRPRHSQIGLYFCASNHEKPQSNQFWTLSWHRDLRMRFKKDCLDVQSSEKNAPVWLWDCHGQGGNQFWYYDRKKQWLRHGREAKNCLDADPRTKTIFVNRCDEDNPNMQWKFGVVNDTALDTFFDTKDRAN